MIVQCMAILGFLLLALRAGAHETPTLKTQKDKVSYFQIDLLVIK